MSTHINIHQVISLARHRNGVCGAPFNVILFDDGESRKLGIVFDAPNHCAVLDLTKLAEGDIAFGSNSYRGDRFEPPLRRVIDALNPQS
jgi:hypothetical protein